jgi:hypothetical protein
MALPAAKITHFARMSLKRMGYMSLERKSVRVSNLRPCSVYFMWILDNSHAADQAEAAKASNPTLALLVGTECLIDGRFCLGRSINSIPKMHLAADA